MYIGDKFYSYNSSGVHLLYKMNIPRSGTPIDSIPRDHEEIAKFVTAYESFE